MQTPAGAARMPPGEAVALATETGRQEYCRQAANLIDVEQRPSSSTEFVLTVSFDLVVKGVMASDATQPWNRAASVARPHRNVSSVDRHGNRCDGHRGAQRRVLRGVSPGPRGGVASPSALMPTAPVVAHDGAPVCEVRSQGGPLTESVSAAGRKVSVGGLWAMVSTAECDGKASAGE